MDMHCCLNYGLSENPQALTLLQLTIVEHNVFKSMFFIPLLRSTQKATCFIINIHLHHEYEFIKKLSCGYERKAVFAAVILHELIMFKVNQKNLAFQCCSLLIFNKLNAVSVLTSWCWIFKHTFFVSVNYLIISVYMCIFFCFGLKSCAQEWIFA